MMIRVVIVDDSALDRTLLQRALAAPDIEVVATAKDGREALRVIAQQNPDVIITDLRMPNVDGLALTRAIMATRPRPILVVTHAAEHAFALLEAGARDVLPKAAAGDALAARELVRAVREAAGSPAAQVRRAPPQVGNHRGCEIIVIGASTGGPPAIANILRRLPEDFRAPVVCVQHIAPGFHESFAAWLDRQTPLIVHLAAAGGIPRPGCVYVAPGGRHLTFARDGSFMLDDSEPIDGHRPSVTATMRSAASHFGPRAAGVLLSGMGRDGAAGLDEIRRAGGATIAQDKATSVVFGMPAEAIRLGAARLVAPIGDIAGAIEEIVRV